MKKLNIGKTLVIAGLLSATVSAQAGIMNGEVTWEGKELVGEFFIGVVDRTAEISFNKDLGILFDELLEPGKSWTFDLNNDANFAQFVGKSGLEFNAFAATVRNGGEAIGTSNEGLQPVIDWLVVPPNQGMGAIQGAALIYSAKTNSLIPEENLSSWCSKGDTCYHDSGPLGPNLGGPIPMDTDGEGPLLLWHGVQNVRQGIATEIGEISLENGILTVETTVVPVPAAVWMFGSALLGLIGVRRRNA